MTRTSPRAMATAMERRPRLPTGQDERLVGYGVWGLPFTLGDVLAFRRYTASSIGPAFTSVWHVDPDGNWTVYTDIAASRSCPRYLGPALRRVVESEIRVEWTRDDRVAISVPGHQLEWAVRLESSVRTRVLNVAATLLPRVDAGSGLPDRVGAAAGRVLQAGPLRLSGTMPNGQRFALRPRRVWLATASAAMVEGRELGPIGPHGRNARLGDLVLPDRGVFAVGETHVEPRRSERPRSTPSPMRATGGRRVG
ncbi:MAG: hypothetical protein P8177_05925 [Gemmatimonadota bacterium]